MKKPTDLIHLLADRSQMSSDQVVAELNRRFAANKVKLANKAGRGEIAISHEEIQELVHKTLASMPLPRGMRFGDLRLNTEQLPARFNANDKFVFSSSWPLFWSPARSHNIVHPPGSLLSGVAEFLFSPKTVERVVKPIISDLQVEYCEAPAARRRYKAEWVRLQGVSWRAIAEKLGVGVGTLYRVARVRSKTREGDFGTL